MKTPAVDPLQRTCTELLSANDNESGGSSLGPAPVIIASQLAEISVLVLLGEPGMGKSETMKALAIKALGDQGKPITANDFIVLPAQEQADAKPVFIDALDEARASGDTTVWRELRRTIAQSKLTRFAVACRVADWQTTDAQDLATVAQGKRVRVFALDPLTPEQRRTVLAHEGIKNPDDFEQRAGALGFADMLGNPQSLKLLAAAVKKNQSKWPQTRRDAYELACQELLQESNPRHRQAQRSVAPLSDEALLNAAGWLCALMLLSNQGEVADEALVTDVHASVRLTEVLDVLPTDGFAADAIWQVLQRRLFTKPRGYTPTHRTVAEYLAARYIAQRIAHGGLLVSRVSALMLASSQHLVSNLRGLAGWLAVLSEPLAQLLFEVDPWAVLDYGDLHLLSTANKQVLIAEMGRVPNPYQSQGRWQRAASHVPLVQPEMFGYVSQWLERYGQQRDTPLQTSQLADALLDALGEAPTNPQWEALLNTLVRQAKLGEGIRASALMALCRHAADSASLVKLLNDIHSGEVPDVGARLTDGLLSHLYPTVLPASEAMRYCKARHRTGRQIGTNWFWRYQIEKLTPDGRLLELMDAIEFSVEAGELAETEVWVAGKELNGLATLTVRAIELLGTSQPIAKLSQWLYWCTDPDRKVFHPLDQDTATRLHQWLRDHPEQVRAVLELQVATGMDSWTAQYHLAGNVQSDDLGAFWLDQAKRWDLESEPVKARDCMETAIWWGLNRNGGDISLQDLENAAANSPTLREALERRLVSPLDDDNWQRKNWLQNKKYRDAQADRHKLDERNRLYLLGHLNDVRNGKLLAYLSGAAWADLAGSGYGGGPDSKPFKQWRETHPELDEATRQGYQTLLSQLSPTQAATALKNHKTGRILHVELPCLLAAQQLFEQRPQQLFDLGEDGLKALITLHLLNHVSKHEWFLALAGRHADWVEEVWWSLCKSSLRSKKDIRIPQIGLLRHESGLMHMALRMLPRLLAAWPSKVTETNFAEFAQVLESVLLQCGPDEVSRLVAARLKRKSLGSLQTGYLLMAGVWVDHQTFAPLLRSQLTKKQILQTELLGFIGHLRRYGGNPAPLPEWDAPTLGLLFKIFGPLCPSTRPEGIGWVGARDEGRDFLHQLLAMLRNDTTDAAQQELQGLLADPALVDWQHILDEALSRQARARADKAFSLPTPRQVALTLQNKAPANPADLMAITIDVLGALQREIRNSATNLINGFWNVDPNGKRPLPPHRPEPACRDVIAEWLRQHLQAMNISAQPENQHGAQNQSDIALTTHVPGQPTMLLPIEVNGDWHRDLWTSATEQLAKKYASEPRCHGQGVYLVLWLGSKRGAAAKPKQQPNYSTHTPADLQACLQLETNQKTNTQGIRVFVLDVSIPD